MHSGAFVCRNMYLCAGVCVPVYATRVTAHLSQRQRERKEHKHEHAHVGVHKEREPKRLAGAHQQQRDEQAGAERMYERHCQPVGEHLHAGQPHGLPQQVLLLVHQLVQQHHREQPDAAVEEQCPVGAHHVRHLTQKRVRAQRDVQLRLAVVGGEQRGERVRQRHVQLRPHVRARQRQRRAAL